MDESNEFNEAVNQVYDRLEMEKVFHLPSSAVQVKYHSRVKKDAEWVRQSVRESSLLLDVYATGTREGTKLAAAFLANMRLKAAQSFGSRHGPLLYVLPIVHLFLFLLVMVLGALTLGFVFGISAGLVAATSLPLLIIWVASVLERRRSDLKDNLTMTDVFDDLDEIDEMVLWLNTKTHSRNYWVKRILFYEIYYIPLTLFLFLLSQS